MAENNKAFLKSLQKYRVQIKETLRQVPVLCTKIMLDQLASPAKGGGLSPVGDPASWSAISRSMFGQNYEPGTFISNWQVGINNIPTDVQGPDDPSGQYARDDGFNAADQYYKLGDTIHLVNNTPYAMYLEQGYSPQNVDGIIMQVIPAMGQIFQQAVRMAK